MRLLTLISPVCKPGHSLLAGSGRTRLGVVSKTPNHQQDYISDASGGGSGKMEKRNLTETFGTLNVSHLRCAVRPRDTLTKLDTATDCSPANPFLKHHHALNRDS